ncbi:MAG: RNA methyltransferase [Wenzhouxiangellaceae bacterium]
MKSLANIRIVLDHTSHPGNIGAAARAMKVMGLDRLHLVNPQRFPHSQATALASSADDLLDAAHIHPTLAAALEGCTLVLGTSARRRSIAQEILEPREAAARAVAESGPVALVFGCEKSGLDNAALDRCHALVSVPTGDRYMSLNLAQAVQVLCYELHLAGRGHEPADTGETRTLAPAQRLETFFERLEHTMAAIGFSTPGQTETLHRRMRRVFQRARLDDDELNMLNGILSRTLKLAAAPERRQEQRLAQQHEQKDPEPD